MAKAKYTYSEKRKGWYTYVWDGTYTDTGAKRRKIIISHKSSADLEKMVDKFRREVESGSSLNFSNLSFYDYAQKWIQNKSTREKNTIRMYKDAVSHFKSLNTVRVSDITHTHYQVLINENASHPRTCEIISITFNQIIRSAIRDKLLPKSAYDDITSDIDRPKRIKKEKRPLTPLEKEALFKADLDERKRCFVSILYYCGLRKSEALALTRFDFDFAKECLTVNKAIIFDKDRPELKHCPKSDNGYRTVPIPKKALPYIRPFVEKSDGYIFHGQNCDMMTGSAYKRMWESIIVSMNVALGYNPNAKKYKGEKQITDLTAHIFRHNYCTELCYQIPKITTKKIARMMGDTEKMVLDVYSHIIEEKEDVQDVLSEAF